MTQQRAKAASAKAVALSLLAIEFGQKLAALQSTLRGDALGAAIAALMREQRAAERALVTKLAAEADVERQTVARQFRGSQSAASLYRGAAAEISRRQGVGPGRPRARQRGTRAPRLQR